MKAVRRGGWSLKGADTFGFVVPATSLFSLGSVSQVPTGC